MAHADGFSRRDFFKTVGIAAGAAGITCVSKEALAATAMSQDAAAAAPSTLPEPAASPFPTMNRRSLGWLRFLWEKATTPDDWSSVGIPHPWWDRYSSPVVLSYGRFDLSYSAYGIMMMADQTPAWREAYARITDEFAKRYPTYWGAIDWLTQIGDDPKRAKYPPQIMATLPPDTRPSMRFRSGDAIADARNNHRRRYKLCRFRLRSFALIFDRPVLCSVVSLYVC